MTEKLSLLANRASSLLRKEAGGVAFEYALIVGGVSVDANRIERFFDAYAGTMGPEGGITCINSAEMP